MDHFVKAAADLFDRLGKPAEYRRAGRDPVPCRYIPHRDVEALGEYGQVVDRRTVVRLLKSEVSRVTRGDRIVAEDEEFRVGGLDGDNGYVLMVAVTR